jgi:hypothetical protein
MDYASDIGNTLLGSYDVDACMAYCYATFPTAVGGFLVAGSNICYCKAAMVGDPIARACTSGVGFYKGALRSNYDHLTVARS